MPRYGIPSVHHQERANKEEQGGTKHRADDATSGSYGGIGDDILIRHWGILLFFCWVYYSMSFIRSQDLILDVKHLKSK